MDLPLILDILLLRFANNRITPKRSLSVTAARAGFQRLTVVTIRSDANIQLPVSTLRGRVCTWEHLEIFDPQNEYFTSNSAESALDSIWKYDYDSSKEILYTKFCTAFHFGVCICNKI